MNDVNVPRIAKQWMQTNQHSRELSIEILVRESCATADSSVLSKCHGFKAGPNSSKSCGGTKTEEFGGGFKTNESYAHCGGSTAEVRSRQEVRFI
jgi:hypothetical protein